MRVGFVGLGLMGQAMALRLVQAGGDVVVWNRSPDRARPLHDAGATVAADLDEVFASVDVALLMLSDSGAVDAVLDAGGPAFARRVATAVIVPMGTTSPESSLRLASAVAEAGGRYAEAPVSGSRPVAEQGQLVGMLAGEPDVRALVRPALEPLCREVVDCGPVPQALNTKLAVNVFLVAMVCGLAEAWAHAESAGVDLDVLRRVLDEGPMSSAVSRAKSALLAEGAFPAQASIDDVLYNANLIRRAAAATSTPTPLTDASTGLLEDAVDLGLGRLDMVAVVRTLARRTR